MWMVLGGAAIVAAACNLIWMARGKETKWFRFFSLALTALTLCAFYGGSAKWVLNEDWSALMDVVPTMSKALWGCTAISIVLNGISLFEKRDKFD